MKYIIMAKPRAAAMSPSPDAVVSAAGAASLYKVSGTSVTITNVSPSSGLPGIEVVITGSGFGSVRGSSTVSFTETTVATYVSWSPTSIRVRVPPLTMGYHDVTVTVGSVTSNGYPFYANATINVVSDYSADNTGATSASAAIQSAVTACAAAGGGTVYFPAGTYSITTSIKLPQGDRAGYIGFIGSSANVVLSGATSFLEFQDTDNWQSFRRFLVQGFDIDATSRWAGSSGYVITAFNAFGNYFVKRGNVEYITIKDLNVHGAPSLGSGGTAVAIALGCKQGALAGQVSPVDGVTDSVMNYVRHITIDNVAITGGDTGILVNTELSAAVANVAPVPSDTNMTIDDITISNVTFDSGQRPPYATTYMHTGIQVGVWGRGGTCTISNCTLRGSADNLLEIDNFQVATVSGVACIENRNHAFTLTRFGYPLDAVAGTDEGTMTVSYTDCYYDEGDTGVGLGWGYDYDEVLNHTAHPTYHVTYTNCYTVNSDDTVTYYTGP